LRIAGDIVAAAAVLSLSGCMLFNTLDDAPEQVDSGVGASDAASGSSPALQPAGAEMRAGPAMPDMMDAMVDAMAVADVTVVPDAGGPPPERLCGNGTIELSERCDPIGALPHGHCDERCAIVCDPGYSDCDGNPENGCERDVSATPDAPAGPGNLGAGCVEVLIDGQAWPTSIALDATHVYWTNLGTHGPLGEYNFDGTVMAMPLAGGEPTVLAEDQRLPGQLVLAGGYLYWINRPHGETARDGAAMRVPLSGGPPEVVAQDLLNTSGLAVDETYAYFFTSQLALSAWSLVRVNKDGSGVPDRLLSNLISRASTMVMADGQLYWKSNGLVNAMASDGSGEVRDLAESREAVSASPSDLVLDGDRLFWIFDSGTSTGVGSVLRAGGATDLIVEMDTTFMAYGLAVDSQHAYWAHQSDVTGSRWLIARTDKQQGDTTVVLGDAALNDPQFAASDDALYIAVAGSFFEPSGMLLKLAK
jgi:hypothetical protein